MGGFRAVELKGSNSSSVAGHCLIQNIHSLLEKVKIYHLYYKANNCADTLANIEL
jgi:hypothetical protein